MTRRTRYFLLGSAGLLVAGLCTGLVTYYGGFPSIAFSYAGPQELRYVPADSALVAYANVRDVMASDLRQRLRSIEPDRKEREEFEARTGINIESDIDHVVACLGSTEGRDSGLVLIRGRIDDSRLEALAREHGARVEEYRGKRLLLPPPSERRGSGVVHGGPAVTFLEAGLVALGDEASVRRALDLEAGGENITTNEEIMKLVREIEGGQNAWAVGRFDRLASHASVPPQIREQIPAVQWFAAAGRINGGVTGTLRAEASDDAAAENLRDVVRGFLALAKLQSGSRPEFQHLMQSIELGGTGRTVALSFSIPSEMFDMLTSRRPRAVQP